MRTGIYSARISLSKIELVKHSETQCEVNTAIIIGTAKLNESEHSSINTMIEYESLVYELIIQAAPKIKGKGV